VKEHTSSLLLSQRRRNQRSEVRGSRFEVRGPRFEVRGSRSEFRGPRFELRGRIKLLVRMPPTIVEGYWGKPTATIDWCEENYEVWGKMNSTFKCIGKFSMIVYYL
jgi:hypothetical protein